MIKKAASVLLSIGILAATLLMPDSLISTKAETYINNASLMPKYIPDSEVQLDAEGTPEWASGLIMAEVHINSATKEGTLKSAVKILDHYQEMGVNGLWITPVSESGDGGGYVNYGPHSIDSILTGKEGKGNKTSFEDYKEGWLELKGFIDEAHKRNIRIIIDVVSWGVSGNSPLVKEHPSWFQDSGDWGVGSKNFLWRDEKTEVENKEFVDWYKQQLINIAVTTGCDGFRHDLEPAAAHANYTIIGDIRRQLYEKGRKILFISEQQNERGQVFDFEQFGVYDVWQHRTDIKDSYTFLDRYNLVDSIKNGENIGSQGSQDLGEGSAYRFYTYMLSCHDSLKSGVAGNRLAIGYQAIFAPFIPVWFIGEEWGDSYKTKYTDTSDNALYFRNIDWSLLDHTENRKFYEDVKAMLRIRLQYPEIFSNFPSHLYDSNICKVNVSGCEGMMAYARYSGDTAIIIVPNYNIHDKSGKMRVYVPFKATGLDYYKSYKITDAITGENIVSGNARKAASFDITVPYNNMRVIKVEASGKYTPKAADTVFDNTITDSNTENNSGSNEEYFDEPDSGDSNEKGGRYVKKRKSKKGTNASADDSVSVLMIVLSVIGGVIVVGAAVIFIILVRKKRLLKKQ